MICTASRGRAVTSLRSGFTIIEVVVVLVVIGILSIILIVSYSSIQTTARKQAAEADAQGIASALTKHKSTKGTYPASLDELTSKPKTESSFQYAYNAANDTYCLTSSVKGASVYVVSGNSKPKDGGCPGHGINGEPPITNLVKNPGVRTNTTGWSNAANGATATAARVATGGPSGVVDSFYRLSTTTAPTGSPVSLIPTGSGTNAIPIEPSTTYTYSIYVRSSCAVSAGIRQDYVLYTNTGASIGTFGGTYLKAATNTWHRMSRTFTTSEDAAYMRVYVAFSGPTGCPASSTFDATGVMLVKGATDYKFSDGASDGWIWNGAANNSSSTGPGRTL